MELFGNFFGRGMKRHKNSYPMLIVKNEEMLKGPQEGPAGVGDELKSPAGLWDVRKYVSLNFILSPFDISSFLYI